MSTGKKKAKGTRKVLSVPEDQWMLPVSVDTAGQLVSLRDVVTNHVNALSFGQLSPEQQSTLVAERISRQPKFELAMIGPGIIGKDKAIREVRARTDVGRTLIEIEQRVIARMMKRADLGG